jgi:hypothetical protein
MLLKARTLNPLGRIAAQLELWTFYAIINNHIPSTLLTPIQHLHYPRTHYTMFSTTLILISLLLSLAHAIAPNHILPADTHLFRRQCDGVVCGYIGQLCCPFTTVCSVDANMQAFCAPK